MVRRLVGIGAFALVALVIVTAVVAMGKGAYEAATGTSFDQSSSTAPAVSASPLPAIAPTARVAEESWPRSSIIEDAEIEAHAAEDARLNQAAKQSTLRDGATVGRTNYVLGRSRWSKPDAKHLLIEITARNDDKKAIEIPPFMLVDEQGAEYRRTIVEIDGAFGQNVVLNPGISSKGVLVFRVPKDRTYTLQAWDGSYTVFEPALFSIEPVDS